MAFLPYVVRSKFIQRQATPWLKITAVSMLGFRSSWEDSYMIMPTLTGCRNMESQTPTDLAAIAVFDGHAGKQAAQFLTSSLPKEIEKLYNLDKHGSRLFDKQVMKKVCMELDKEFMTSSKNESGSTATIASMRMNGSEVDVMLTWVGDSPAMVIRDGFASGKIDDIVKPHIPNDPSEKSRIAAAKGFVEMNRVNGNLAMSRAFGDRVYKTGSTDPESMQVTAVPSFATLRCSLNDILLVCSDGLTEAMSANEIASVIKELHDNPSVTNFANQEESVRILCDLLDASISSGSGDNHTVLICEFTDPTKWTSREKVLGWSKFIPAPIYTVVPSDFYDSVTLWYYLNDIRERGQTETTAEFVKMLCQQSINDLTDALPRVGPQDAELLSRRIKGVQKIMECIDSKGFLPYLTGKALPHRYSQIFEDELSEVVTRTPRPAL